MSVVQLQTITTLSSAATSYNIQALECKQRSTQRKDPALRGVTRVRTNLQLPALSPILKWTERTAASQHLCILLPRTATAFYPCTSAQKGHNTTNRVFWRSLVLRTLRVYP